MAFSLLAALFPFSGPVSAPSLAVFACRASCLFSSAKRNFPDVPDTHLHLILWHTPL